MTEFQNSKIFDLEDRTLQFASLVRNFVRELPKTTVAVDDIKQVVRSSGSVGANYIEANEALSKKDFLMRIKICRKEAKESTYWLKLLQCESSIQKNKLIQESIELTSIFGSIIHKFE